MPEKFGSLSSYQHLKYIVVLTFAAGSLLSSLQPSEA
jgi:hypothetical protein